MKRYAIQFADGNYARPRGARCSRVPIEKAKMWNARNHVTSHLQSTAIKYPAGTSIVEVSFTPTATRIVDVEEYLDAHRKRSEEERRKRDVEWAKQRVRSAEAELAAAKAALG